MMDEDNFEYKLILQYVFKCVYEMKQISALGEKFWGQNNKLEVVDDRIWVNSSGLCGAMFSFWQEVLLVFQHMQ